MKVKIKKRMKYVTGMVLLTVLGACVVFAQCVRDGGGLSQCAAPINDPNTCKYAAEVDIFDCGGSYTNGASSCVSSSNKVDCVQFVIQGCTAYGTLRYFVTNKYTMHQTDGTTCPGPGA